jgi:hypothetical protein
MTHEVHLAASPPPGYASQVTWAVDAGALQAFTRFAASLFQLLNLQHALHRYCKHICISGRQVERLPSCRA